MHGHFVSNAVKNYITSYFTDSNLYMTNTSEINSNQISEDDIYKALTQKNYEIVKNSYLRADHELNRSNFDVNFSGTTAVTAIIIGKKLICANSGDSRGIIVYESKSV